MSQQGKMAPPNFQPGNPGPQGADTYIRDTLTTGFNFMQNPLVKDAIFNKYPGMQRIPAITDYVFSAEIRHYFNVSNKYVVNKIKMILLPFIPQEDDRPNDFVSDQSHHIMSMKKSLNSPDLYIPLMAIMTFILLICFTRGMGDQFQPDLIGYYTTNCVLGSMMEIFIYKIVLILVHIKSLSVLDLIALVNYKYVGLCLIVILNLILSSWFIFILQLYTSFATVLYMYNVLKSHAQSTATVATIGTTTVPVQSIIYFLSGFQFFTVWILIRLTA